MVAVFAHSLVRFATTCTAVRSDIYAKSCSNRTIN